MAEIKGYNIVAKMLKDAGVECVFTITGGHITFLWEEFEKLGIKVHAVTKVWHHMQLWDMRRLQAKWA